jgi:hypothetical protein
VPERRLGDAAGQEALPQLRKAAEKGTHRLEIIEEGRQQHESNRSHPGQRAGGLEDTGHFVFLRPMLGRLARQVHLHEELDGLVQRTRRFVETGH